MSIFHFIKRQIFVQVRYILSNIFPKNKYKLFFDSIPDYSDNSRSLSDYIISHSSYEDFKIIWAVNDKRKYKEKQRICFISKSTYIGRILYIYHTLTSKYLFSTHFAFHWANPKKQIYVLLWHGSPLKRVARMLNPQNLHYIDNCSYVISPSEFYKDIMELSFGKPSIVTGYPRNDELFKENNSLEQLNITKDGFKIVTYMPTFRRSKGGGKSETKKNMYKDAYINFNLEENVKKWNDYLEELKIILIVKPHPLDADSIKDYHLSNIIIVTSEQLIEKNIHLYSLLHYSDALLTDFSSVYCDYLLLNRPIGFMISDIDEYSEKRGFVFDKPIDYMPGFLIRSIEDFKLFLSNISQGIDDTQKIRTKLSSIYNKFSNNNCKRLLDVVIEE